MFHAFLAAFQGSLVTETRSDWRFCRYELCWSHDPAIDTIWDVSLGALVLNGVHPGLVHACNVGMECRVQWTDLPQPAPCRQLRKHWCKKAKKALALREPGPRTFFVSEQ